MRCVLGPRTVALLWACWAASLAAQQLAPIRLPAPRTDGGKPLMQALKNRHTSREFSPKKLSEQLLSDLLWAAFGVNRPQSGRRTAPSAWNQQEIDIYVFTSDGVWIYDAAAHLLKPVLPGDHRSETGTGAFAGQAPVSLVYVADYARTPKSRVELKPLYAAVLTGAIGQNVYLFCASEGLAAVIHNSTDDAALGARLGLRPDQQIILAQAVGYPP